MFALLLDMLVGPKKRQKNYCTSAKFGLKMITYCMAVKNFTANANVQLPKFILNVSALLQIFLAFKIGEIFTRGGAAAVLRVVNH